MGRIEKTVFLSYRRANLPWALNIFQHLTHHGYDVFLDYNGVSGGDFEPVLLGNIKARAHFLLVLTPSALDRCDTPGDWLRREIETALETQRNIVPLLLDDAKMDTPAIANRLTGSLVTLKNYQALNVPPDYFNEAMSRLREKYLNIALDAVLHPLPPIVQRKTSNEQTAAKRQSAIPEEALLANECVILASKAPETKEKIRLYSEAIRLKPRYADGFYLRGLFHEIEGDLVAARQDFDEAIRLKPDYAKAFCSRGHVRHDQGDYISARKDYDEAIRLIPHYAEAFRSRGLLLENEGDLAGARKDYDEAIRLDPDLDSAFYQRGSLRSDQGDLAGARLDLDEAIRLDPDFAEALLKRGVLRMKQGDLAGAGKDLDEVIRLNPVDADAFHNRGLLRSKQGDPQGARKDYDEAISLKPDFALAIKNRSLLP